MWCGKACQWGGSDGLCNGIKKLEHCQWHTATTGSGTHRLVHSGWHNLKLPLVPYRRTRTIVALALIFWYHF